MTKSLKFLNNKEYKIKTIPTEKLSHIINKLKTTKFELVDNNYYYNETDKRYSMILVKCCANYSDKCKNIMLFDQYSKTLMCHYCAIKNPEFSTKISIKKKDLYKNTNKRQEMSIIKQNNYIQNPDIKQKISNAHQKLHQNIEYTNNKLKPLQQAHRDNPNIRKCAVQKMNSLENKQTYKINNLEKYGVEYYTQTQECKEKIKQTCINKYGNDSIFQNKEIQEKIKQTNIKKYGVTNYTQTQECKEKTKTTMLQSGYMYTDQAFLIQIQTVKPKTNIIDVKRIEGQTWEFTDSIHGTWRKKCTSGIQSVSSHKIKQFLDNLNSNFTIKQLDNNIYEIINLELNPLPFITKYLKQTYEFDQHFYPEKRISKLLKKLTYNYQYFKYSFNTQEIERKYSCEFSKFKEHIEYKFVEYYGHSIHECTEKEYNALQLDHSIPAQFFKKYFPNNWELLANHYTNVKYIKNLNNENQRKNDKYFFNELEILQWYSDGNIKFPEHLFDFREERKIIFNYSKYL